MKPSGVMGSAAGWVMAHRGSNRARNQWTVDLLNVQSGDCVLEIGCGPGLALNSCLARVDVGKVIGLDHSQTMLDQARARNAEAYRQGRLELQLGNVDGFVVANGGFEKIYSVNVVQFLPDPATTFQKLYSHLKPNGVAATTYLPRNKNPSRVDALEMAKNIAGHMEAAGFKNVRVEELPLRPFPAVCVLGER